ncbi:SRPBCC domain-containing protein [Sediminibacterium soli]|uniref:SRPBCC domain-containing protein n=1 Tax=Sediminibacterium soli TaxID=2698829 RepID=UPI00137B8296|nr:SRPBCC domain-containing protein [Sediminibacterium soli]NCI45129.1 ATPase [Sediminibacterium soli]
MNPTTLEIKAGLQIARPVHQVFDSIVDPAVMCNYFISWGSGRMEEGQTLQWRFPEFDETFPIRVGSIRNNSYVSYYWANGDKETLVEITLTAYKETDTVVTVTEKSMSNDEAGINWLKGNTEGWANFLACMKAWLEYGVHLRKGAFDFRFEKPQQKEA